MRILVITYCFPPLLVPATMCYVKLILGLVHHGVDVEVMTIAPDSFDSPGPLMLDHSLCDVMPECVVNHAVRSPESATAIRFLKRFGPTQRLLYRWFEPKKREWTYAAVRRLDQLDLTKFDLVITCSQPHCNHLLGLHLKHKTDLPWIAYFGDPWTDNPYGKPTTRRIADYNRRLELQVLEQADLVLFTSQEMLQLVSHKCPPEFRNKASVLPHCFVPDWYDRWTHDDNRLRQHVGGAVHVVHTGHFYGSRSPEPLLRALKKCDDSIPLNGKLRFSFFGSMPDHEMALVRQLGLDKIITLCPTIGYLESLAMMKEADYLLLIDAMTTTTAESVFLPSKLIDYFGAGKPVIGITPTRGTSARVLREVGGIVCDVEDETAIVRAIMGIIDCPADANAMRQELLHVYDYRKVAGNLLGFMDRLVKHATRLTKDNSRDVLLPRI